MKNKNNVVYFGAAGGGIAYLQHTGEYPDLFVDNDSSKWGTFIDNVEILSPNILTSIDLREVIITSGYIKEISKQVESLGVEKNKIVVPPKSLLGLHPFIQEKNRLQAATKLYEIMDLLSNKWNIVAVGGTALGFCRDNDFIHWDFDIDLFAPIQAKSSLLEILMSFGCDPKEELMSIKATLLLDNGVKVPLGVDFFDENLDIYIDKYEDYTWQWPITMFTQCSVIEVHGKLLNVPNPPDVYLSKVYGNSWSVPNPEFCYSDYSGSVS